MASEQDRIVDGLNKPALTISLIAVVVGFLLCLTIALLPLGLIVMAAGGIGAAVTYFASKAQTRMS